MTISLSLSLTKLARYVGLDLNADQITENQHVYNARLEFVHTEVTEWIRAHGEPGTIFVAWGALTYFTPRELRELFALIPHRTPAAIAISDNVNLVDTTSTPMTYLKYRHNYPHLLSAAGYTIFRQSIKHYESFDAVMMVATIDKDLKVPFPLSD